MNGAIGWTETLPTNGVIAKGCKISFITKSISIIHTVPNSGNTSSVNNTMTSMNTTIKLILDVL